LRCYRVVQQGVAIGRVNPVERGGRIRMSVYPT
jgi:hypothetical protein